MTLPNINGEITNYYFNIFIIMAEETKPKDITPMKRKGIDIVVSGVRKSFPFVMGYKDDTTTQYDASHYIDLIIDLNKLSEYMDIPISPFWYRHLKDNPTELDKTYALWSYLSTDDLDKKYSNDIKDHPGYKLGKEVHDLVHTIYEYLPEEYTLQYDFKSEWSNMVVTYPVNLRVNAYYHKLST
jgi:hypothetical protein